MKKIKILFCLILLTTSLSFLILPETVFAAGCGYQCNSGTDDSQTFCSKQGYTLGSIFNQNGAPDCSGEPGCGMYSTPACCCSNENSPITPGSQANTVVEAKPPKFEIPKFQIPISTVELTEPACSSTADGVFSCEVPWIGQYISGVYNYGLNIAGILAAIMLMAGGVLWLISGGDASRITQAKELIIGSITGLIILVGSYILLIQINPDLVSFQPLGIGTIRGMELKLAKAKDSPTARQYNASCATDAELAAGTKFYATGYYKPAWENSDTFRCIVAMQCTCPNGRNMTKNCDQLYGRTYPGYNPCNEFPSDTAYCNKTKSGSAPQDGDIAGPSDCPNLPLGDQVCFEGKTYKITDAGGGIKGKRIDIWSGTNLQKALDVTGVGILKKGACN